jgi:t-SNARE complex subunit (syntaxin)
LSSHKALDPRRNIDGWAEQKGELERALREALFLAEKSGLQYGAMGCNGNIPFGKLT